jgi:hypothetical protein
LRILYLSLADLETILFPFFGISYMPYMQITALKRHHILNVSLENANHSS